MKVLMLISFLLSSLVYAQDSSPFKFEDRNEIIDRKVTRRPHLLIKSDQSGNYADPLTSELADIYQQSRKDDDQEQIKFLTRMYRARENASEKEILNGLNLLSINGRFAIYSLDATGKLNDLNKLQAMIAKHRAKSQKSVKQNIDTEKLMKIHSQKDSCLGKNKSEKVTNMHDAVAEILANPDCKLGSASSKQLGKLRDIKPVEPACLIRLDPESSDIGYGELYFVSSTGKNIPKLSWSSQHLKKVSKDEFLNSFYDQLQKLGYCQYSAGQSQKYSQKPEQAGDIDGLDSTEQTAPSQPSADTGDEDIPGTQE